MRERVTILETGTLSNKRMLELLNQQGFSVASGVLAVADPRITVDLGPDGLYRYGLLGSEQIDPSTLNRLMQVSAMSEASATVDELADELFANQPAQSHHSVVGYYLDCYAGHVSTGTFREQGSSGGLATWVLSQLYVEGLIDGVVHVKASSADAETLFEYSISRSVDEIRAGAKSRYYPAEFSRVFKELQLGSGRFAFVGIPEILREVRLLSRAQPSFASKIPYLIGLVCGHQKSSHYAGALAWQVGISPSNLVSVDFRKALDGEPANIYSTEFQWQCRGQIETRDVRQSDLLVANWGHGAFKAKFSDFTDDVFNETADLTVGDAWLPEYVDDCLGNNVAIARNPVLHEIIEKGVRDGALLMDRISPTVVVQSQSGLVRHCRDELPYRLWKLENQGLWHPPSRLAASSSLAPGRRRIQDLKAKIRELSFAAFADARSADDWQVFADQLAPVLRSYRFAERLVQVRKLGVVGTLRKLAGKVGKRVSKRG